MMSLKDALKFSAQAIKSGLTPSIVISNQLISLYSQNGFLRESQRVFDEMPERNVFTWNAIIWAYIKTRNLNKAREIFVSATHKDIITYNSMLSGYVSSDGYETQAVDLFADMRVMRGEICLDGFSITTMISLATRLLDLDYGQQLHSLMVKCVNDYDRFAVSSLIDMYSKCGCLRDAHEVFKGCSDGSLDLVSKNAMVAAYCREGELEMAKNLFWREFELNDTVSWNTLILGYAQNGYEEEAVKLFVHMMEDGFRCNEHTAASVLNACSGMKNLKMGKEIHAWVLKSDFVLNSFIISGIVDTYCKCGSLRYAESVLKKSGKENSFAVTSMIVGHASQNKMVEARRLFDSLAEKNSVVYTALFSGYLKSQQSQMVFELFRDFIANEATVPDASVLITALGACAVQASLDPGKQIHGYLLRMEVDMEEKLSSSLVDMYAKCGSIWYAESIFKRIARRDAVLYNVMLSGYAHHGHEHKAIELYQEMLERGIKPNAVTFIALLSACRHCGLAKLGEVYFNSMTTDWDIPPETDHYACMIDLYGRANQLEKAVALLNRIPLVLDAVVLGSFVNACKLNRNVELATQTVERLMRVENNNGARYVQLANLYAAEGKWVEMGSIRKKMRGNEAKKLAGCSWLYAENRVHIFTSGDKSHLKAEAIYSVLSHLTEELNYLAMQKLRPWECIAMLVF